MPSSDNNSTPKEFSLSKVIDAHKNDVKTVIGTPTGSLISASRDGSMKLWSERAGEFVETLGIRPNNPVGISSAGFYCTPDNQWVLFAGRKDGSIAVFTTQTINEPLRVMHGHRSNVCTLYVDSQNGLLLSGSWDHHALVWPIGSCLDSDADCEPLYSLEGHANSVWAVATLPMDPVLYLTGSADKTIKMFNNTGKELKSFAGHKDVVRHIVVLSETTFLSAANDSALCIWDITSAAPLQRFESHHGEFIYSVCKLKTKTGAELILSCGEKGYVELWNLDVEASQLEFVQQIRCPVASVWTVNPLRNADFAIGTNEGSIFIYTLNEQRRATEDVLQAYDAKLAHMFEEETAKRAAEDSDVVKIKVAFDDGQPQMELKHVKGADPEDTARMFIAQNNLSMSYLSEITDFIRKSVPASACSSNPKSEKEKPRSANYEESIRPISSLAPLREYFVFDLEGASQKTTAKLREFNELQTDEVKLSEDELCALEQIMGSEEFEAFALQVQALERALQWPIMTVVPVIDVFRVALLDKTINEQFCSVKPTVEGEARGFRTLQRMIDLLVSEPTDPVRIVVCRALTNAACHEWGQEMLMSQVTTIATLLVQQFHNAKQAIQIPASSALANMARIFLQKTETGEVAELGPREDVLRAIIAGTEGVRSFGEYSPVALVRFLQAIVTLMWGDSSVVTLAKNRGMEGIVNRVRDALYDENAKGLARDILVMTYA